jgi:outer membrane protein assembly factor BamB
MTAKVALVVVLLILSLGGALVAPAAAGKFEDLGIPIRKAGTMGFIVGPDKSGTQDLLYCNFNQDGGTLFLVVVDPDTGEAHQYNAPEGPGAWAEVLGPDNKIYLGTWDGGLILRFDPGQPEKGIEVVGKPSETETYIWQYAIGKDGKLYGCTYGNAKLISYDPKTGEMADLGRMDETQMYTRSVAAGPSGKIYAGVGTQRANVVAYDPATGEHKSILPDEHRLNGGASVWQGEDGNVYAVAPTGQYFRAQDDHLVPIAASEAVSAPPKRLRDGRIVSSYQPGNGNATFTLLDPKTNQTTRHTFTYQGAGSGVFVVGEGPDGQIYGSSAMPLEMFEYDPQAGSHKDLGNPTPVDGEIYSFATLDGLLYLCAYPGSWLSVYDPTKPWNYGTEAGSNPLGIGNVGDGHLRPRAMVVGPDKRLYIGSLPPYGQLGGALGIYDPAQGKVVENYRNLIRHQSIFSLCVEPKSGLVFGGSSVAGGGGATPSEREAHFFAWDPAKKAKVLDIIPLRGCGTIAALAAAEGKVFGIGHDARRLVVHDEHGKLVMNQKVDGENALFVYDPAAKRIVDEAVVPFGSIRDISLGLHSNGLLYGLTQHTIFSVDPRTYETKAVAEFPDTIDCGFALTDTGLYFGSGVHLVRYRW